MEIKYPKGTIYPESSSLREIIESYNWELYDTTNWNKPKQGQNKLLLNDLQEQGPAKEFIIGNNYLFTPKRKNGQSLRDAYSVTKGFGPSLKINDLEDPRWEGYYLVLGRFQDNRPIIFTRLDFQEEFLGVFTPASDFLPDSDKIVLNYDLAVDTFKKYFRVIPPEEEGLNFAEN